MFACICLHVFTLKSFGTVTASPSMQLLLNRAVKSVKAPVLSPPALRHHTHHLVPISQGNTTGTSHWAPARMWDILPQPSDSDSVTTPMQRPSELLLLSVLSSPGAQLCDSFISGGIKPQQPSLHLLHILHILLLICELFCLLCFFLSIPVHLNVNLVCGCFCFAGKSDHTPTITHAAKEKCIGLI